MKKGISALTGFILAIVLLGILLFAFTTKIRTGAETSLTIGDRMLISMGLKEEPVTQEKLPEKDIVTPDFVTLIRADSLRYGIPVQVESVGNRAQYNLEGTIAITANGVIIEFDRGVETPIPFKIARCGNWIRTCSAADWEVLTPFLQKVSHHKNGFTILDLEHGYYYRLDFVFPLEMREDDPIAPGKKVPVNPNTQIVKFEVPSIFITTK